MYIIKQYPGMEQVDGGQTRQQVETALKRCGAIPYNGKCPTLPRFGKAVFIANPLPLDSFVIENI